MSKVKFSIFQCSNEMGSYYTIVNNMNGFHCHARTKKDCQKIVEVANQIATNLPVKSSLSIRNRAMRLLMAGKVL